MIAGLKKSLAVVLLLSSSCAVAVQPVSRHAPVEPEPVRASVAEPPAVPVPAPEPEPAPDPSPPPTRPRIAIHKGTRVLMFGDSMVTSGLGVTLKERVEALGGTWFHVSKPSSTTATWSEGHALEGLLTRARPDVVIVVLASNELFVPNPGARAGDVRAIVRRIATRPCLWVGPAPWLPEKGIIGVVRAGAKPCQFFDSSALMLERGPDGIHPSLAGGRAWADAVWEGAFVAE